MTAPASPRYVHPNFSRCSCGSWEWSASGHNRTGFIRYRRCRSCGLVYSVPPLATEKPDERNGLGRFELI